MLDDFMTVSIPLRQNGPALAAMSLEHKRQVLDSQDVTPIEARIQQVGHVICNKALRAQGRLEEGPVRL
jgi:hypothetical protein